VVPQNGIAAQNTQRKEWRLTLPVLAIGGAKGIGEGAANAIRLGVLPKLRQRGVQFVAGPDAELGIYLAQVPFDRAGGQEQLGADLRVRQAVAGQPGDLLLLRR
jgi:hypothetical protein